MSDPREGNADQDTALARQALAQRDLPHALHHIGCALTHDPMHRERMQLLNEIIAAAPDPMALVQLEGDVSFVDAANKSYVLAWMGRWVEALDLVTDVAEIRPDVPYLKWCEWWMSQPGVLASIPLPEIIGGIVVDILKIASRCPIPTEADDARKPTLESGARILAAIRQLHPAEGMLWFGSSMVARRIGATGEALQFAQHAYQIDPSWKAAVGVANALRDAKRVDEAAQWFAQALKHDPKDVSAHLDCGDMMLDADRLTDAQQQYDAALKKEPDHPWATASNLYIRYLTNKDAPTKLALLRLTEAEPPNHRAEELYEKLDPPRLYLNRLPHPADASANALNAIFEEMFDNPAQHHGSTVRLKLSHLESPSVVGAFWLQMEMWGPQVGFDYQVETIQQPDPRQPKAQVPFQIWRWDGTQPKPGIERPSFQTVTAIHGLASEPFALDVWTPIAERTAAKLGGSAAIRELLGTLVFPPRPPGSAWRVLPWVQRAQIATALTIASCDPQTPWQGSPRQQALYGLLYGPSDWTTGAAIIALGVLARRDAAIRAEVVQAFGWLFQQIPREGFCPWEAPLVVTWLTFPDVDDVTKQRLTEYKARIFDNKTGGSSVRMVQLEAKKFDMAAEVQAAQAAQQQLAAGGGGDPDPVVFPGQKVARLSDYVRLMKAMQTGNMMGALGQFGLDMMGYASVATAWGQKLAQDPPLNAKFAAMMAR
jgi:tetratricopeptide (TPR) repeat protein